MFEVNVFGLIAVTKAFLRPLRAFGRGARIINIGSISGLVSPPIESVYSATSKTA